MWVLTDSPEKAFPLILLTDSLIGWYFLLLYSDLDERNAIQSQKSPGFRFCQGDLRGTGRWVGIGSGICSGSEGVAPKILTGPSGDKKESNNYRGISLPNCIPQCCSKHIVYAPSLCECWLENVAIANALQLEAARHRTSSYGLWLAEFVLRMRTNCYFQASD